MKGRSREAIQQTGPALDLLKKFSIECLIDVHSRPYSKLNPHFNREDLAATLESKGIKYVFMGEPMKRILKLP